MAYAGFHWNVYKVNFDFETSTCSKVPGSERIAFIPIAAMREVTLNDPDDPTSGIDFYWMDYCVNISGLAWDDMDPDLCSDILNAHNLDAT